ncbi:DNA2/NAM7 helicase family [Carpediemonas membranifera]|uniref:DNA2/NAM7 helicase family n=1 Tax=Carpediemonas membranifera TaxID=201153 RepID=A0A8J6E0S3_9EUKA|nr:DNA2/NAM7 helicase family [Carpediemonas membranifera]|eukprot:KAG9395469.1 DNA2/NAM7 helicase family [Carpediemonas membranifera]
MSEKRKQPSKSPDALLKQHHYPDTPLIVNRWLVCSIEPANSHTELHCLKIETGTALASEETVFELHGPWRTMNVATGDVVTVHPPPTSSHAVISPTSGAIAVSFPDLLLSPTTLAQSIDCVRRGVLSQYDSPPGGPSDAMTVGVSVHEAIQSVLMEANDPATPPRDVSDLRRRMEELCEGPALDQIKGDGHLLNAALWIDRVLRQGYRVKGVEYTIVSPVLGLRGKIDIVLGGPGRKTMLVEVKTGKLPYAMTSSSTRAQAALYHAAWTIHEGETPDVVVLGTRGRGDEGVVSVEPEPAEIATLLAHRSSLAARVWRLRRGEYSSIDIERLPPRCDWCPHIDMCNLLGSTLDMIHPGPDPNPRAAKAALDVIAEVDREFNEHDTPEWVTPTLRTVSMLAILTPTLVSATVSGPLPSVGQRVVLGTQSMVEGQVVDRDTEASVVTIATPYGQARNADRLDLMPAHDTTKTLRHGPLLGLEGPLGRLLLMNRLPTAVAPLGDQEVAIVAAACAEAALSNAQTTAARHAFTHLISVVEGLPGAGKSHTIGAIVAAAARLGKTVLICTPTRLACGQIVSDVKRAYPDVSDLISDDISTIDLTGSTPPKVNVVAITTHRALWSFHALETFVQAKGLRQFDILLVDEAAQVQTPTLLPPTALAARLCLIGDVHQLGPVVKRAAGLRHTVMDKLLEFESPCITSLSAQYRMNDVICRLSSQLVYDGRLKPANETVASYRLNRFEDFVPSTDLDRSLSRPVSVFDLSGKSPAEVVPDIVSGIKRQYDIPPMQISVVAAYRADVSAIRAALPSIEVDTVDSFQGQTREAVVFVCTSPEGSAATLLGSVRRINVAVTRPRGLLVVVADRSRLGEQEEVRKLVEMAEDAVL